MRINRDTVVEVKRAVARKTSLGTLELIYRCPSCNEKLSSQKEQVSDEDSCPTCGQRFSFSKRIKSNWERVNAEHNNSMPEVCSQGRVKQPSITENKINKVAVATAGVLAITLCLVMVWDGESDHVIPMGQGVAAAGTTVEPDVEPDKMTPETIADALKSVVHLRGDTGSGSGFLISDRLVVTNHHVVKGQAKLVATLHDGVEIPVHNFKTARQNLDLAILILAKPTEKPALDLEQKEVELYGQVYALGSPMGFDFSVSDGMVSACRKWSDITQVDEGLKRFQYDPESDWIQFTAPVSHGNSGGPLINADGNVVGINTLASSAVMQNLNFAVDVNHLRTLIETLDTSDLVGHELASLPNEESNKTHGNEEKAAVQNIASDSIAAWDYAATITGDTFVDIAHYFDDLVKATESSKGDMEVVGVAAAHFALKQITLLQEKLGRFPLNEVEPLTVAYIKDYQEQLNELSKLIRSVIPMVPTFCKK
jgi:S1-C subfamily serine protease/DNA-directed RNA polymerase subunit RPC12/RpoP